MARLIQISLTIPALVLCSCAAHKSVQPKTMEDLRADIKRCPVHDELLIEATNSVDFERGSYDGRYYEIRNALFPAAFDDPFSVGEMALVTYCPKCRAAKKKYLRDEKNIYEEFRSQEDVQTFIEHQRRELDAEFSKE